jgi:hypothetical protein
MRDGSGKETGSRGDSTEFENGSIETPSLLKSLLHADISVGV